MAPQLPPLARAKLLEYIDDKIAGVYCHNPQQARRFAARLMTEGFRSHSKTANGRSTDMLLQPSRFTSFGPESAVLRENGRGACRTAAYATLRLTSFFLTSVLAILFTYEVPDAIQPEKSKTFGEI